MRELGRLQVSSQPNGDVQAEYPTAAQHREATGNQESLGWWSEASDRPG